MSIEISAVGLLYVAGLVLWPIALVFGLERDRRRAGVLSRLAKAWGIQNRFGENRFHMGTVGKQTVVLELSGGRVEIRSRLFSGIPGQICIRPRNALYSGPRESPGENPAVLTSDPQFDSAFLITARDPREVSAVLDFQARVRIQDILQEDGMLKGSTVSLPKTRLDDEARFIKHANEFLGLISDWEFKVGTVPIRLSKIAVGDPVPQVRGRCLELLNLFFANTPQAEDANRALLSDPIPDLRIMAAGYSGEPGMEILLSQLESASPRMVPAVREFVKRAAMGPASNLLAKALRSSRWEVQSLAVNEIAKRGWVHLTSDLAAVFPQCGTRVQDDIVMALGTLGDPKAEPLLLEYLKSGLPERRVFVVRSLGESGTIVSVEPLLRISGEVWERRQIRLAARGAVRKIQSRLSNAERGTISLAETAGPEGAVSLAPQGGEVSEAPPKAESRRESDSAEQETS